MSSLNTKYAGLELEPPRLDSCSNLKKRDRVQVFRYSITTCCLGMGMNRLYLAWAELCSI